MAKALDVLGHAGDGQSARMGVGVQLRQLLLDQRLVLADQRAFGAPLLGVAKHIKRRATQALELGQQRKSVPHGRPIAALEQLPLVVARGQQWGCQVVVHPVVALELLGNAREKAGLRVQPRDLVLVLVGHQLEQVVGHRFGQSGLAQWGLGLLHTRHKFAVTRGVGGVLVIGEVGHAACDALVQRCALVQRDHLRRLQQRLHPFGVLRRMAAPFKGQQVVGHRHRIEFDGPVQRSQRQRHPALLPGVAQEHGVDINRVAHDLLGQAIGVEGTHPIDAGLLRDFGHAGFGGVLPIAVFHKGRRRRAVAVECHTRAAFAHAQQGFLASAHDRIATQNQVGTGHAHAGGADGVLVLRHDHMAPGGAAFLRQTRRVLCDDALALDVCGHAQQLADGDDAGAAHARHHRVPGLGQARCGRLGQCAQRVG